MILVCKYMYTLDELQNQQLEDKKQFIDGFTRCPNISYLDVPTWSRTLKNVNLKLESPHVLHCHYQMLNSFTFIAPTRVLFAKKILFSG